MSTSRPVVRPITGADLEAIIALDTQITGNSRRGFYTKRFAAAQETPKNFVWLAAEAGGKVVGFVSAHIQDGEFGGTAPIAVIDSIGIEPAVRGHGIARALMETLEGHLKARQITELHTEADWHQHALVQFFAAAGFQLAPSLALESPITTADF